uniref:5-hmdU DNA kinase helical domain-containing protein n=1 Tax=Alexandrium monilatum TaxID=311494 RepID=A0A7S4UWG9_9DINO|mmetsp:Transcript_34642/g.107886  ORF Transcript_34642/g.107886 Transcript_34642/m.107886 type:complete len:423 (-) Transcript_34642:86-1354(-)
MQPKLPGALPHLRLRARCSLLDLVPMQGMLRKDLDRKRRHQSITIVGNTDNFGSLNGRWGPRGLRLRKLVPKDRTGADAPEQRLGTRMRIVTKRRRRRTTVLGFADFVLERLAVLQRREAGEPPPWSADRVLQLGAFCNIDRRDDRVTRELLSEIETRGSDPKCKWQRADYVTLVAVLRFTGSRRGEAATIASLIDKDRPTGNPLTGRARRPLALEKALRSKSGGVRGGNGAYQVTLSFTDLASLVWRMATAVDTQVAQVGPFADVKKAADFVKALMTPPRSKRTATPRAPAFSSTETAKDFEYLPDRFSVLCPQAEQQCHLGPGARKGIAIVRRLDRKLLPKALVSGRKSSDDTTLSELSKVLIKRHEELRGMRPIDIEQALCEYAKYHRYRDKGIGPKKRFHGGMEQPPVPVKRVKRSRR